MLRGLQARVHGLGSGIVFTRVLEDDEVDRRGLAIESGSRVIVVCGAGDRALDAVVWGAGEVTAVDLNPSQLRLSALKVAAAGSLDHPDLIAMFSSGRRRDARRLYSERLRSRLAPDERRYWDQYIDIFEYGLHQHQPVGIALSLLGWLLRGVGGRELRRLIAQAPDAGTQSRWYERRLRSRYWNPVTRWLMRRTTLLRWMVVHEGERESMQGQAFHEWLEARISRVIETSLVRENPYLIGLLAGRPAAPEFEEAWLRPESCQKLRGAPAVIRFREASIVDELEARSAGSIDAVGLSNVPDWLDAGELHRLWAALAVALVPRGRAVLRSAYRVPPLPTGPMADVLKLDRDLSAELTDVERTGIYANVSVLARAPVEPAGTG